MRRPDCGRAKRRHLRGTKSLLLCRNALAVRVIYFILSRIDPAIINASKSACWNLLEKDTSCSSGQQGQGWPAVKYDHPAVTPGWRKLDCCQASPRHLSMDNSTNDPELDLAARRREQNKITQRNLRGCDLIRLSTFYANYLLIRQTKAT